MDARIAAGLSIRNDRMVRARTHSPRRNRTAHNRVPVGSVYNRSSTVLPAQKGTPTR